MKHRIVVLGAGYAGTIAAGRLARRLHRDDVEITVVNADADFVERVRLHQLASGQDLPRRPLRDVFAGTGVRVRTARVTAIDVAAGTVALADGDGDGDGDGTLGYDTLVHALGSTVADHGVPGVAEHAFHVAGKEDALRLRSRLAASEPGESVLVVGGGLTAVETAAELAEAHPRLDVALAAREGVGDWLSDKARARLRAAFERLGVTVHEGCEVARVEADGVVTRAGERRPAGVTVWAAGFAAHPVAAAAGLEVSADGRVVVDATMRSVSHPDVYAVGDAAFAPGAGGRALRMGCATASPMAWQAADAIAARLSGRTVPTTVIGYAAQCISLGRRDAVFQRVTETDGMTSTVLTGRAGALVKELICAGARWSVAHPTLLVPARRRRVVVGRDGASPRTPSGLRPV